MLYATLLLALAASPDVGAAPKLDYSTAWVGNSFGGGPKWVQNGLGAIAVDRDGTVYANSYWDEAGREAGVYRAGDVVGAMQDTHGWGHLGGEAVALDDQYVYLAMQHGNEGGGLKPPRYPPKDIVWKGVVRRKRDGSHAPFPGGIGDYGDLLLVSAGDAKSKERCVKGLAASRGELFVSDALTDFVRVYRTSDMTEVRHWEVRSPSDIAVSGEHVWVIRGDATKAQATIIQYTREGKPTGKAISGIDEPLGLCVDAQGRVLVADNGPRQQVLIFDVSGASPKLVDALGEEHGVYAGPVRGKTGPNRLCGPNCVGVDAKGNIVVGCSTPALGTVLRMYSPSHELVWELLGLEFVDVADADPKSDGTQLYTPEGHYLLKPDGWSWEGFTLDPFTSPDDPRLRFKHTQNAALIRYMEGRKFLILRGMWQSVLAFYRFDGEIARPCTIIASKRITNGDWEFPGQPIEGAWIWRDLNGDARMQANEYLKDESGSIGGEFWASSVDERGDVWQGMTKGVIRRFRFGGLDARGYPIYSRSPKLYSERQIPPPIDFLLRAEYVPDTETMYLSGHTPEHPKPPQSSFGLVGTDLLRYDSWNSRSPRVRWHITLPGLTDGNLKGAAALCVEANRIFVVMGQSAEVRVYDTETGDYVGSMKPGPEVHGESGWIDFRDAIRARKLSNGDYLVMVEDDAKGKTIVYRLKGQK